MKHFIFPFFLTFFSNFSFSQNIDSELYFPYLFQNDTSTKIIIEEFNLSNTNHTQQISSIDTIQTYYFNNLGQLTKQYNGDSILTRTTNGNIVRYSSRSKGDSIFFTLNAKDEILEKCIISQQLIGATQIETTKYLYNDSQVVIISTAYGILQNSTIETSKDTLIRNTIYSKLYYENSKLVKTVNGLDNYKNATYKASEFRYTYPNEHQILVELYSFESKKIEIKWVISRLLQTEE